MTPTMLSIKAMKISCLRQNWGSKHYLEQTIGGRFCERRIAETLFCSSVEMGSGVMGDTGRLTSRCWTGLTALLPAALTTLNDWCDNDSILTLLSSSKYLKGCDPSSVKDGFAEIKNKHFKPKRDAFQFGHHFLGTFGDFDELGVMGTVPWKWSFSQN